MATSKFSKFCCKECGLLLAEQKGKAYWCFTHWCSRRYKKFYPISPPNKLVLMLIKSKTGTIIFRAFRIVSSIIKGHWDEVDHYYYCKKFKI